MHISRTAQLLCVGLSVVASTSASTNDSAMAQPPGSRYPKVDVHVHFIPPLYRDALIATGNSRPDGMPGIPPWDPETHLALMRNLSIAHSILSISSPGISALYPASASSSAALARRCNEYAAGVAAQHPTRLSYWAALPLPFVAETLAEIDRLNGGSGMAGFGVMTSYAGGKYLGNPAFDPVWERLNDLGASVFMHPTTPAGAGACACEEPTDDDHRAAANTTAPPHAARYPSPLLEFPFDTARTITDLLLARVPARYPRIKFVAAHAGGAFPPLLSRAALFSTLGVLGPNVQAVSEHEMDEMLRTRFWYDLAGAVLPKQIVGLMQGMGVGADRLLYGSDYPFTAAAGVALLADKLEKPGWLAGRGEDVRRVLMNGEEFVPGPVQVQ